MDVQIECHDYELFTRINKKKLGMWSTSSDLDGTAICARCKDSGNDGALSHVFQEPSIRERGEAECSSLSSFSPIGSVFRAALALPRDRDFGPGHVDFAIPTMPRMPFR